MGRGRFAYENQSRVEILAVGIEADRHSFCGAVKRFESQGSSWNGLLSLKELCARRIALIKDERCRWFINSHLSEILFQYVTRDLFDLRREAFLSNYAEPLYMCQECCMDTCEPPPATCRCPNLDEAIERLNKHLFKSRREQTTQKPVERAFELIYKRPNDGDDHERERKYAASCFLYLSPYRFFNRPDSSYMHRGPFDCYQSIHGQVSAEEKLLFVDAMRFLGAFRLKKHEPELIFYRRSEFVD